MKNQAVRSYWAVLTLGVLLPWALGARRAGEAHGRRAVGLVLMAWGLGTTHGFLHLMIWALDAWQGRLGAAGLVMPAWSVVATRWLGRFNLGVVALELLAIVALGV